MIRLLVGMTHPQGDTVPHQEDTVEEQDLGIEILTPTVHAPTQGLDHPEHAPGHSHQDQGVERRLVEEGVEEEETAHPRQEVDEGGGAQVTLAIQAAATAAVVEAEEDTGGGDSQLDEICRKSIFSFVRCEDGFAFMVAIEGRFVVGVSSILASGSLLNIYTEYLAEIRLHSQHPVGISGGGQRMVSSLIHILSNLL